MIANIEVNIDYPEYEDIEVMTIDSIKSNMDNIEKKLNKIVKESETGKIIRDGIKTVIIGRPNVGKSSILNKLLDYDKAIVTDIAGTTRDIVEGEINLDGVLLKLVDTAGIRETTDVVEKIGVDRSYKEIEDADLIIMVLNNNEELSSYDKELLNKIKDKIKELFNLNSIIKGDYTYLSNARQISLAKECLKILEDVKIEVNRGDPVDLIEIDIKRIWNTLGEITGDNYDNELIDQLFSQFCLGK